MYVCMYVCMYVLLCMYVCMYHTYVCIIRIYVCIYALRPYVLYTYTGPYVLYTYTGQRRHGVARGEHRPLDHDAAQLTRLYRFNPRDPERGPAWHYRSLYYVLRVSLQQISYSLQRRLAWLYRPLYYGSCQDDTEF